MRGISIFEAFDLPLFGSEADVLSDLLIFSFRSEVDFNFVQAHNSIFSAGELLCRKAVDLAAHPRSLIPR